MAKLVLGLGNPGPEYQRTRHNAGFLLADFLATRWGLGPFRRGNDAVVAAGMLRSVPVRVLKPTTFMNASGRALSSLGSPFDPAADLLVLVDDVAFEPGVFRMRGGGSAGGHNGLRSVEAVLRSQQYARVRIGIGARPEAWDDLADWVLSRFDAPSRAALDASLEPMAEAVECWALDGIDRAMNRFNR